MAKRLIDLTGQTFGRLTVLSEAERVGKNRMWKCHCLCGNVIVTQYGSLTKGTTKSCGCLRKEMMTIHGARNTPTYRCWVSMKVRCSKPNAKEWRNYGGRGITFCPRWESFANFLTDMGERPPGMTLERLDNDKGYEPGNCTWADWYAQGSNKRNSRYIVLCAERMLVREACRRYGITQSYVWNYRTSHSLTLVEAFLDRLEKKLCTS